MAFYSLKDLVPKAANKFHLQGELKSSMVINRTSSLLKEVFSEEVERHIRVKRFKDGVLWLAVNNATVNQEVMLKSMMIKNTLNKSFGEEIVQKVRSFQEVQDPEEFYG